MTIKVTYTPEELKIHMRTIAQRPRPNQKGTFKTNPELAKKASALGVMARKARKGSN